MYYADVVKFQHPTAQFRWQGDFAPGQSVAAVAPAALEWLSAPAIPRPTAGDLDTWAAAFEASGGVAARVRDRALDESRALKALALATHQRFKASVPGDTITPAQWQQMLKAAYDSLG